MKRPSECTNINDIRTEIDRIDAEVIRLLGERFGYVKEIVKYKTDSKSIRAQERFDQVIGQRREWAVKAGLSADIIEQMYRIMMEHFIEEETKILTSTLK